MSIELKEPETKRALLIAFHFPPLSGSSGLQRSLSLTRQLPSLGWRPLVLTANTRAYETTNDSQLPDIPPTAVVVRAFAVDTRRHLSVWGRYPRFMALPDKFASWCIGGIFSGMGLIRKYRPSVIWSTYPIATAHLIGLILHRISGLPWVVDFRDSMTEDHYPHDKTTRAYFRWIERKAVNACSKAVFTTPGTLDMYRKRYPDIPAERWVLIPNGYDEGIFDEVEKGLAGDNPEHRNGPRILLHSGVIYPSERDPTQLFEALSQIKQEGKIDRNRLRIKLRACWHEEVLLPLLDKYQVADLVELLPPLPYREALTELLAADALLILQASNCNHQVPAKVYEYFRAQRPILALTDPTGDTAKVIRGAGIDQIVPLDSKDAIAAALPDFLTRLEQGALPVASTEAVEISSRKHAAEVLVDIFDRITTD